MERLGHRLDQELAAARITSETREQIATWIIVTMCIAAAVCLAVLDPGAINGALSLMVVAVYLFACRRCKEGCATRQRA